MKKYKLLLAGLILLLLIIFLGVFAWLWINNLKNTNPLPIVTSDAMPTSTDSEEGANSIAISRLHLQAPDVLQAPLDDVIVRFETRYPKVQILVRYVPENSLLTLPDTAVLADSPSPFIVSTDMIVADDELSQDQLTALQALLNAAQTKAVRTSIKAINPDSVETTVQASTNNVTNPADTAANTNSETRNLVSFSYALKDEQSVDGVILTDNPTAITFRNFLLSSTGQDILKQYNYGNIDGYKSSMDDLFNPTTHGKTVNGDDVIEVEDVLTNSE